MGGLNTHQSPYQVLIFCRLEGPYLASHISVSVTPQPIQLCCAAKQAERGHTQILFTSTAICSGLSEIPRTRVFIAGEEELMLIRG